MIYTTLYFEKKPVQLILQFYVIFLSFFHFFCHIFVPAIQHIAAAKGLWGYAVMPENTAN